MPNTTKQKKLARRFFRANRLPKGPNGGTQLLLIQSVDKLGKQGDIVEVKRGYAVNYLIPQGLATLVTDHNRRMIEKHRAQLAELEKNRLDKLRALAKTIQTTEVSIEANAAESGQLYGSVGAVEIVNALKDKQITITADQVRLEGPLKECGRYTVKIHLASEIEADMYVWVIPTITPEA